jgi:AcrR family transcriptional regulator
VTVVDAAAVDGRRARRERGRVAVVDAMVDLIQEGVVPPGADAVAERAGVSVASVFRYFDGLADLQEAAMVRYFERYRERFEVPGLGEGDLDERIERLVRARLASTPSPSRWPG